MICSVLNTIIQLFTDSHFPYLWKLYTIKLDTAESHYLLPFVLATVFALWFAVHKLQQQGQAGWAVKVK